MGAVSAHPWNRCSVRERLPEPYSSSGYLIVVRTPAVFLSATFHGSLSRRCLRLGVQTRARSWCGQGLFFPQIPESQVTGHCHSVLMCVSCRDLRQGRPSPMVPEEDGPIQECQRAELPHKVSPGLARGLGCPAFLENLLPPSGMQPRTGLCSSAIGWASLSCWLETVVGLPLEHRLSKVLRCGWVSTHRALVSHEAVGLGAHG